MNTLKGVCLDLSHVKRQQCLILKEWYRCHATEIGYYFVLLNKIGQSPGHCNIKMTKALQMVMSTTNGQHCFTYSTHIDSQHLNKKDLNGS